MSLLVYQGLRMEWIFKKNTYEQKEKHALLKQLKDRTSTVVSCPPASMASMIIID